jgi:hypothetical protein
MPRPEPGEGPQKQPSLLDRPVSNRPIGLWPLGLSSFVDCHLLLLDPESDVIRVEADEVAHFDEGNSPLCNEAANMPRRGCEPFGQNVNIDKPPMSR